MHATPVLHGFGLILLLFSPIFLPPLALALVEGENSGAALVFLLSLVIVLGTGLALAMPWRRRALDCTLREVFLLTALFWVGLSAFGALPFLLFKPLGLSVTDALFEAMSGLTTTGATVLSGLDDLPRSLLLYRQSLQWLGGIGLVVIAVAVLPMLGIGGMQLYRAEVPGPVREHKLTPRITGTARILFLIYCFLTIACALSYRVAGMGSFDAICHGLTTVAIGGFSTHDASFGFFADRPAVLLVACFFMIISGINFALHFQALNLRSSVRYLHDPECRMYLLLLACAALVASATLLLLNMYSVGDSLLHGVFQAVSIATTTGYASAPFAAWPGFLPLFLFCFAFVGTCAGSTGGGIKVIRLLLIRQQGLRELHFLLHPNAVRPVKIGHKAVPDRVLHAVWGFLAVYLVSYFALLMGLLLTGLDFTTAFYAVSATINNLGPGLGQVAENYGDITSPAKWILSASMILGRLEILSVFVLLTPAFWRR